MTPSQYHELLRQADVIEQNKINMTSKFFGSPKPNQPKKGDKKTPTPQPKPVKTTQIKKTGRGK